MRLVTYEAADGTLRAGAFIDDDRAIVDLAASHQARHARPYPALASVLGIIEGGDLAMQAAAEAITHAPQHACLPRIGTKLRAPVQPPPQMRDCSAFELHLIQSFAAARKMRRKGTAQEDENLEPTSAERRVIETFRKQPIYYKANRFSVIGTDEDVIWPPYSKVMDYELEFGCYMSKPACNVPREHAREFIFGYTIFNDFSARDAQGIEMGGQLGPAKGKDFDTGNAMGPCLVTADEIGDPYNLQMIARVNGEEWSRGTSATMHWHFEDIIAHISQSETLYPGEFLGSGTVGNGCGLEQLRFLKAGDVVELEVEKIGILSNRVTRS